MQCTEDYFENINTEEKAYWLGFLYADGCVTQNHDSVILCLSIKDTCHVELFKKCLSANYNISFGKDNRYARIVLYKNKIAEDLIDKGCVPSKSLILKFPTEKQVPNKLMHHFIRGYFDGDGCIYATMRKKKNSSCIFLSTEVNFLGTNDFLKRLSYYLPVTSKLERREKDNISAIRIYDKMSILKLMNYMYQDSSIYLYRKYIKFLKVEEYVNNK